MAVTHAGDARLFVTLQAGQVLAITDGQAAQAPFLDIRDRVLSGGERGLLSVAFHPDFAVNGFLFVDYTNLAGDTIISRFQVPDGAEQADGSTEAVLLLIPQPFDNHNGGQLQFGPDGFLYAGMGDGGDGDDPLCNAQRQDTLLGKLLRLDVDQGAASPPFFSVPPDNPFVGEGGFPDETWAFGLRNPWRFSFDRESGDLYIGDVGQGDREEVNLQPAGSAGGANYGWKVMEGTLCRGGTGGCPAAVPGCGDPELTPPILEYDHGGGRCAIIGGYVYRGGAIPSLAGAYVYGDLCRGTLWAARSIGGAWESEPLAPTAAHLTSFGEDIAGELYLTASDSLRRFVSDTPPQPGTVALASDHFEAAEEQAAAMLSVRRSGGANGAISVRYATADGTARSIDDYVASSGTVSWEDGETADKAVVVPLVDDEAVEGDESFTVTLDTATGGSTLGAVREAVVTIVDDDVIPEACTAGATTLCLAGGRFRTEARWRTATGDAGDAQAVVLSPDSGYFWFFEPDNPELFVKVIDACDPPFHRFWVFAAGLTDVETVLTVVDSQTGQLRRYDKPLGSGFDPIRDTSAFDTCP